MLGLFSKKKDCKKKDCNKKIDDAYVIIQHDDDSFQVVRRCGNGDHHVQYFNTLESARNHKKQYEEWDAERLKKEENIRLKGYPREIE